MHFKVLTGRVVERPCNRLHSRIVNTIQTTCYLNFYFKSYYFTYCDYLFNKKKRTMKVLKKKKLLTWNILRYIR